MSIVANTVFALWLHIAASYGRIDIAAYYAIGELDKVDACVYAQQLGRHKIEQYLREKMIGMVM